MKSFVLNFLRRGCVACGFGPVILAFVYLILQHSVDLMTLTVNQVCIGIFSLSALAFIAGGMNAIYQIERCPLMVAITIHGGVLYIVYLVTYLINNWLEWGMVPILVVTGIFILGYLAIWLIVYSIIKRNTKKLNERLQKQQRLPRNNQSQSKMDI